MSGSSDPKTEEDAVAAAQQEEIHFKKVIESLLFYQQHATERLKRAERSFERIPKEHQLMLTQFKFKLEGLYRAVEANSAVMMEVVNSNPFGIDPNPNPNPENENKKAQTRPTGADMEKVYTTIKQFVRDWSAEGAAEREKCYTPVLTAVDEFFKNRDRSTVSIMVPGSGLGRLAWELASRGYCSQGNEWSVFMLLASNYVLNGARGVHHIKLYPYAHQFSNNFTVQDQLRSVTVPDVDPSSLPSNPNGFSMAAGDFLEIYTEECAWDCIASCFFLDTARNPICYLQKMFDILKPGGILVNLGPLLYHFADNQDAPSVELCYDEMKDIIRSVGFVFLSEKYPHNSPYIDNELSMLSMTYKCVLFVVQKPISPIPVMDPIPPPSTMQPKQEQVHDESIITTPEQQQLDLEQQHEQPEQQQLDLEQQHEQPEQQQLDLEQQHEQERVHDDVDGSGNEYQTQKEDESIITTPEHDLEHEANDYEHDVKRIKLDLIP